MKTLTPVDEFSTDVQVPEDGVDARTAASLEPAFQKLLNRSENLTSRLDCYAQYRITGSAVAAAARFALEEHAATLNWALIGGDRVQVPSAGVYLVEVEAMILSSGEQDESIALRVGGAVATVRRVTAYAATKVVQLTIRHIITVVNPIESIIDVRPFEVTTDLMSGTEEHNTLTIRRLA